MANLFDNLYDVLFEPQMGMKNIGETKPVLQALSVFLGSLLVPMYALHFSSKTTEFLAMIDLLMMIKFIGALLLWIVSAGIWQLVAEFLGGRGTAAGLFSTLGFTHIPYIFSVPLWALITLMPAASKATLICLASIFLIGWSLHLKIVAIKEVHELTMAKAVLVIFSPILFMGILCAAVAIFIGSGLIAMSM